MPGIRFLPPVRATRTRILLVTLGLLGGTLVASILADRVLLRDRLAARIDRELIQETDELRNLGGGLDPRTGRSFGDDLESVFDTFFARNVPGDDEVFLSLLAGRPHARSAGAAHPIEELTELVGLWGSATEPTIRTDRTPAGEFRSLAMPIADSDGSIIGTFVVGRFPEGELAELDEVTRVATLVSGVAFVIASIFAWLFAGRVLAPLERLSTAASRIGEDDLSHRVAVTGTGELADLSAGFNHMLDRVDAAFATQRGFLDDAGHELRTPMTIVRGHLELADPEAPLPASTRALMLDELDRMGRIVDDLLAMARSQRPDFLITAPTDIADLTNDMGERARALGFGSCDDDDREWNDREWIILNDGFVVADVDRERIVQAWLNLVRNAVQHTGAGDRIELFSRVVGSSLELGVADSGEGVPFGDRERIFQRFARGASSRRTRSDGAGLGLAIVEAVATAHGGSVEHRETPGGGATFVICLPLEAPWPGS